MKIAFIIPSLEKGGAEGVAVSLCNEWAKSGKTVRIHTFFDKPISYELYPSIEVISVRSKKKNNILSVLLNNYIRYQSIKKEIKTHPPDIIISFLPEANVIACLIGKATKVPVIISERIHPKYHDIGFIRDKIRNFFYKYANHLVVQNGNIQSYCSKRWKCPVSVIENPIQFGLADFLNKKDDLEKDDNLIFSAGRLTHQKRFDLLIDAFAKIADEFPKLKLEIAGEGELRASLIKQIKQYNLEDRIILPGKINTVYTRLKQAAVFCHTADYEGVPNIIIEALALDSCVLSTNFLGMQKLSNEEEYCILSPCNDAEQFAEKLKYILSNKSVRLKYEKKSHQAVKHLNIKTIDQKWDDLCQHVLQKKAAKKKVAIFIGSMQYGGCEIYLSRILPKLHSQDFDIKLIALSSDGPLDKVLEMHGIPVFLPWFMIDKNTHMGARILRYVISTIQIIYLYIILKPDIVHFYLPQSYLMAGSIGALMGKKNMIMGRRSLNNYQKKHSKLVVKWEQYLHRHMDCIIGNSKAVIEQLYHEEAVPRQKLELIYNGIDPSCNDIQVDKGNLCTYLKIPPNKKIMIMVANLIPYKGHFELLNAYAKLKSDDWLLLLAGGDSLGYQSTLEELCTELGITDKVLFLGVQTNIAEILSICDLAILSSHEEGFSNAILEYMIMGLPVIATAVGGNAEAVINGENGFIVPPKNIDALVTAIDKLLNDEKLRIEMGEASKEIMMQHFTLEKSIDHYKKLYNEILSRNV